MISTTGDSNVGDIVMTHVGDRPPQNVDVLAVMDFQIPCLRPETPALYPRSLLTKRMLWTKTRTSATTLRTGPGSSKTKVGEDVDILRTPAGDLNQRSVTNISNKPPAHFVSNIDVTKQLHQFQWPFRCLRRNVGLWSGSGFPDYCRIIEFREFFPDSMDLLC